MGDFNLPHGDWSGGESAHGATGDEGVVRTLNELTSSHFLVQQVVSNTQRWRHVGSNLHQQWRFDS